MHQLLAGLAIAVPLAVGVAVTPAAAGGGHEVFRFEDPAIVEASALVVDGELFMTTNDSGDTGRVFVVDRRGRTVGVTQWEASPTDTDPATTSSSAASTSMGEMPGMTSMPGMTTG